MCITNSLVGTGCLSLSLTMKGERSDGEEQPLFTIDDETMNIIR